MEDRFQVGVITTTHGVRGEVKVFPTTDDSKRFRKLKEVILDTSQDLLRVRNRCQIGDRLTITLWREGEVLEYTLLLDQELQE